MTSFLHLLTLAFALSAVTPDDGDEKAKAAAMPSNIAVTNSMSMSMYPSLDQTKMNVHVVNHHGARLRVEFLNEKGICYASELIPRKVGTYHLKFNVEALATGTYQIVINDGKNKVVKTFEINENISTAPSRVELLDAL